MVEGDPRAARGVLAVAKEMRVELDAGARYAALVQAAAALYLGITRFIDRPSATPCAVPRAPARQARLRAPARNVFLLSIALAAALVAYWRPCLTPRRRGSPRRLRGRVAWSNRHGLGGLSAVPRARA